MERSIVFDATIPEDVLDDFGDTLALRREIIDLSITAFFVILFIKQLLKVTVDMNDHRTDSMESGIVTLDASQKVLLAVMTRFFILTLFATLSTQSVLLLGTVSAIGRHAGADGVLYASYAFYWWLIPVDCMVNTICLYLMPQANDNAYNRLCSGCDAYVRLCCQRMAKRRIKRRYRSVQIDEMGVELLGETPI